MPTPSRPNILLITTDQQRWDALSLYGTPGYRTPNLDQLGIEGLAFDAAYTPAPICTPARVCMITGQYATRHGAYTIGMEPVPALQGPTLGSTLSKAGYATALIGKTHFVARRIEDQHVAGTALDQPAPDTSFWRDFDGPYLGFEFIRHHRHHNAAGQPSAHYRAWLEARGADLAAVDALHKGGPHCPAVGRWDLDPELTQNAWITDETLHWLDRRQEQSDDRPFCLMAHYQDPHYPLICPEPYYSAVDMTDVDLGGAHPEETDGKPAFYRQFLDGNYWIDDQGHHFYDGKFAVSDTKRHADQREPEAAIRAYIGMCNMVDDYIGRLLAGLRARGLYENTLIIFTSDHGEMLGQHGLWGKGLPAYESNQRVPFLMHWPALPQARPTTDQATPQGLSAEGETTRQGRHPLHASLVDLLPTACEAAGVEAPPFSQGVSLLPCLRGEQPKRDWSLVDHIVSRHHRDATDQTTDLSQTTFIWEGWKLVVYSPAYVGGELYDLKADPLQRNNRWDNAPDQRHHMLLRLAQANMERHGIMPERIGPN